MNRAIKAGNKLIPLDQVRAVDIADIERDALVTTVDGETYEALGFDALEAVMLLKPSALEGRTSSSPM